MLTSPPPIAPAAEALPLWLSIIVTALLVTGSLAVFISALGLARFRSFYDRLHMPGLSASAGAAAILLAGAVYASYQHHSLQFRFALILIFLTVTAPIVVMMLARAAAMRDFAQGKFGRERDIFSPAAGEPQAGAEAEADGERAEAERAAAPENHGEQTSGVYSETSETKFERALEIALAPSNTAALDDGSGIINEINEAAELETALAAEKQAAAAQNREPDAKTRAGAAVETKVKTKARTGVRTKAKAKTRAEAETEAAAEAGAAEVKAGTKTKDKTETKPKAARAPKTLAKKPRKTKAKTETKTKPEKPAAAPAKPKSRKKSPPRLNPADGN